LKKENEEVTLEGLGINKDVVEQMRWDDLNAIFIELATDVQKQQTLILELAKQHENIINNDTSTYSMVSGLIKSIDDVATDIVNIRKEHSINNVTRTGPVDKNNTDDVMLNIELTSKYVTAREVLTNLTSTGFIDIFSKLKIDGAKEMVAVTKAGREAKSKIDHEIK